MYFLAWSKFIIEQAGELQDMTPRDDQDIMGCRGKLKWFYNKAIFYGFDTVCLCYLHYNKIVIKSCCYPFKSEKCSKTSQLECLGITLSRRQAYICTKHLSEASDCTEI